MPTIPVDPQCITPDWLSEVLGSDVRACKLEQIAIDVGLLEGAYRELERRYYAGEGTSFAEGGSVQTELASAINSGNLDRFGDLTARDFAIENRSRSIFGNRSAAEFWSSIEELSAMVSGSRMWDAAVRWLSPRICVARSEREADGRDGEHYAWTHIAVTEVRDGRLMSACLFEPDDEAAASAYAEERVRADSSRLVVANRARQTADAISVALGAGDLDGAVDCFSANFVYDGRRRLSGGPIRGGEQLRMACERILMQYNRFDDHILAVRGERLVLGLGRWSNDSGYETTQLALNQIGDDGRIAYQVRFDEDDFVDAYRELDDRYYADEGAAFAEQGPVLTEWQIALNQRDFDRLFGELTASDLRVENRSSSVFGDRSAIELRASIEELDGMVATARSWHSNLSWLSPHWVIARIEREAVGLDDERYAWSWMDVYEFDGQLSSVCRFEVDDEEAAFAYAEEQVRAAASRLAVTNRASQAWKSVARRCGHMMPTALPLYSRIVCLR